MTFTLNKKSIIIRWFLLVILFSGSALMFNDNEINPVHIGLFIVLSMRLYKSYRQEGDTYRINSGYLMSHRDQYKIPLNEIAYVYFRKQTWYEQSSLSNQSDGYSYFIKYKQNMYEIDVNCKSEDGRDLLSVLMYDYDLNQAELPVQN